MSRSDPAAAQLSTYAFPIELRVDELLVRLPVDADVDAIAPVFRDPAIGGEAGIAAVGRRARFAASCTSSCRRWSRAG